MPPLDSADGAPAADSGSAGSNGGGNGAAPQPDAATAAAAPAGAPMPPNPLQEQMVRRSVHVTPPDVTLCVGNGFIVHAVNCASVVYDTKGKQLTRIIPQNETTWTRKTLLRHQSWATTSVASPALMIARRDASIFRPSGSRGSPTIRLTSSGRRGAGETSRWERGS
ncbi:unnamed protein product [Closterium sp. Naga37s-1]|nr:unnamed protein product [Closterium sp. Naga37s-1]